MKKRFLVEFGTGVDLHGGNVTKAAQKALRDAISHSDRSVRGRRRKRCRQHPDA